MSERRRFTEAEVDKATAMLMLLAHEDAYYWANALMSKFFMHQGRVWYRTSSFYKGDRWVDEPNSEAPPISGEQILTFINSFIQNSRKTIEKYVEEDGAVAVILHKEKDRVPEKDRYTTDEFSLGGWDNDPYGEVNHAMKEAGIEGAFKVGAPYRKTLLFFSKGRIYISKNGFDVLLLNVSP
jgi:hypothetical protein